MRVQLEEKLQLRASSNFKYHVEDSCALPLVVGMWAEYELIAYKIFFLVVPLLVGKIL